MQIFLFLIFMLLNNWMLNIYFLRCSHMINKLPVPRKQNTTKKKHGLDYIFHFNVTAKPFQLFRSSSYRINKRLRSWPLLLVYLNENYEIVNWKKKVSRNLSSIIILLYSERWSGFFFSHISHETFAKQNN